MSHRARVIYSSRPRFAFSLARSGLLALSRSLSLSLPLPLTLAPRSFFSDLRGKLTLRNRRRRIAALSTYLTWTSVLLIGASLHRFTVGYEKRIIRRRARDTRRRGRATVRAVFGRVYVPRNTFVYPLNFTLPSILLLAQQRQQ